MRYLRASVPAGLFLLLLLIRTHDIASTFRLLGEQIRDWRVALGPLADLPLVGTPSTAGGTTWGPVYYWHLWLSRVLIGPFTDNLPHAGGIGISILQSAADAALLCGLARRLGSLPLALAIVLFAATSPYDLVLSAIIWNPAVAVAFAKFAAAAVLLRGDKAGWRSDALVTACAWLSVQAHSAALFVAVPLIGWVIAGPVVQRRDLRRAAAGALAAIGVVLLLQVPYAAHRLRAAEAPRENRALAGALDVLASPSSMRVGESARAFTNATGYLLFSPAVFPSVGPVLLVAAAATCWRWRRDPAFLAVTVAPLAVTVAGFSLWRGAGFEHYWFMAAMPAVAMTLGGSLTVLPPRSGRPAAVVLLLAVMAWVPARARAAWATVPMPEYGALVRGSRQILKQVDGVRAIEGPPLHPTTDPAFLYEVLGGRLSRSAPLVATIDARGAVTYRRAE